MNKTSNKFLSKEEVFATKSQLLEILLELHKGIIHTTGSEASLIFQPVSKTEGRAKAEDKTGTVTLVLTRSHISHELLSKKTGQQSRTRKHTAYVTGVI